MVLNDLVWLYMALYGFVRPFLPYMASYGLMWFYMAVLWSFMVKYWFYWTCIVFSCGHRSKFIWSCLIHLCRLVSSNQTTRGQVINKAKQIVKKRCFIHTWYGSFQSTEFRCDANQFIKTKNCEKLPLLPATII